MTYHGIRILSVVSNLHSGVIMSQSSSAMHSLVLEVITQSGLELVAVQILVGGNFNIGDLVLSIALKSHSQLQLIRDPLGSHRDKVVGALVLSIHSDSALSSIERSLDKDSLRSTMKITRKVMTETNSVIINLERESKLKVQTTKTFNIALLQGSRDRLTYDRTGGTSSEQVHSRRKEKEKKKEKRRYLPCQTGHHQKPQQG